MLRLPGSSIRSRLLLIVVLTAIPLLALILYSSHKERAIELDLQLAYAARLAHLVSVDQSQLFEETRRFFVTLSRAPEIRNKRKEELSVFFTNLINEFPIYRNLILIDVSGIPFSSAVALEENENYSTRPWFQRSLEAKDLLAGEYRLGSHGRENATLLAYPVRDEAGQAQSVLCAFLNIDRWVDQIIPMAQLPAYASLMVLSRESVLFAHRPDSPQQTDQCVPDSPTINRMLMKREGFADGLLLGNSPCLYGFAQLHTFPEEVFVVVGIPRDAALERVNKVLTRNLILLGAASVISIIIALISAEILLLSKFLPLTSVVRRLAQGDFGARTGRRYGRSEFSRLARMLDEMAAGMEKRQVESEQIEEVLRETGRRFRAIFNNAFQFTAILEPDGRILEVNQTALDFFGKKMSDVFDRPFWETPWWSSSPQVRQRLQEDIARAAKGVIIRGEAETLGSDGKIAALDFSIKPLRDESGQVTMLIAEARDITERKRAEKALMESEARYRAIVEDATEIIVRFLPDGKITFVNEAYCRFLNKKKEELLGRVFRREMKTDDIEKMNERILPHSPENPVAGLEQRVANGEGDLRWLQWTAREIYDRNGEIIEHQAVGHDITDRKKAEESLQESQKTLRMLSSRLLKAQEDERKRIARELHDSIGQSLSAVKFAVENAINKAPNLSHQEGGSLESIVPTIQHAIDDVRRIMTDLRPSILDDLGIEATLRWFCREYQNIYTSIHIEKEIDIEEQEIPLPLKTVLFRITQEALNNIAKHSKASFVRLVLKKENDHIELVIEDDGEGFDPESAFYCAETKSGFGLSSMRERAELSGGCCRIESIRGEGTTIRAVWLCDRNCEEEECSENRPG